jgi:hypothetical protein
LEAGGRFLRIRSLAELGEVEQDPAIPLLRRKLKVYPVCQPICVEECIEFNIERRRSSEEAGDSQPAASQKCLPFQFNFHALLFP